MKLKNYLLNEELNNQYMNNELKSLLSKVPKDFLKACYQSNKFLYRGKRENILGFKEVIIHDYREPLDSPKPWHKIWDLAFEGAFGWKARSQGVFATGSKNQASQYGNAFAFFPLDQNYKILYSDIINDLTNDFLNEFSDTPKKRFIDMGLDPAIFQNINPDWTLDSIGKYIESLDKLYYLSLTRLIKEFFEKVYFNIKNISTTWFNKMTSNSNEITFKTNKYLLINIGPNVFNKWVFDTIEEILKES